MVKTFRSSFPPFHNLVKIKVHCDKLNNTALFIRCNGFIYYLQAVVHKINFYHTISHEICIFDTNLHFSFLDSIAGYELTDFGYSGDLNTEQVRILNG